MWVARSLTLLFWSSLTLMVFLAGLLLSFGSCGPLLTLLSWSWTRMVWFLVPLGWLLLVVLSGSSMHSLRCLLYTVGYSYSLFCWDYVCYFRYWVCLASRMEKFMDRVGLYFCCILSSESFLQASLEHSSSMKQLQVAAHTDDFILFAYLQGIKYCGRQVV